MIRPDRHTNLDLSIVNISAFILKEFRISPTITYDNLLIRVVKGLGEEVKELYPYSLNFLYLLGKISYNQETDLFKYNEA